MISLEYRTALINKHKAGSWGGTGARYAGDLILERLLVAGVTTVLDFGCGQGSLKQFIEHRAPQIKVAEYDPGVIGKDGKPRGTFDAVVSSDVLEHIEPKHLTETIRWLASKANRLMIHDIACYPTGNTFKDGPYTGWDHHLTVQSPEWWRDTFRIDLPEGMEETEYQHREFKTNRPYPKTRCLLVHKRIER